MYTIHKAHKFLSLPLVLILFLGIVKLSWAIDISSDGDINISEKLSEMSIIPNASKLEVSYEDEYEAFEKELFSPIESKSRTKRFIYLNSDTQSAVALLLGVPLTIVLPSLSNIFNKWRKRRSVREGDSELQNNNFEDDPIVQPQLDRISTYFELIDIPEHHCQLRAICEFSAEPEKYYPLSEMIISRIRNPSLPAMFYSENDHKTKETNSSASSDGVSKQQARSASLFRMYNEAANEGLTYGDGKCQKNFGKQCQYSMDKLLNMPTLRFWTAMQNLLRISFRDGDTTF